MKLPSRSLSIRSLSQLYCNVSKSPAVSREIKVERVMLSPSINSNTFVELVIVTEGATFMILTLTDVIAWAPSSSVTVAVIWRTPRVDHMAVISRPIISQSLIKLPSLLLSSNALVSQHTSRLSRSDAVSSTWAFKVMLVSSKIFTFEPSPEILGGTFAILTVAVRICERAPSSSYADT